MKPAAVALALTLLGAASTWADTTPEIEITRGASRLATKGPQERFTGNVQVEPLFSAHAPARASAGNVTFEPGARSAWHTHPLGQTLIVTAGRGRVQFWGGAVKEIRPGDVVWIPPGQKHWHGAAPDSAMTHTAIQEQLDGKVVDWLEKVSDDQYGSAPAPSPTADVASTTCLAWSTPSSSPPAVPAWPRAGRARST